MPKPTMIDVWDEFTLEEKQALCVAFERTLYRHQARSISVGALALMTVKSVHSVVGTNHWKDSLGTQEVHLAERLYYKLKELVD